MDYFQRWFLSSQPQNFDVVLDAADKEVTKEMNGKLTRTCMPQEVKEVLFQMHLTKTPGANGRQVIFFQRPGTQ